MKIPTFNPDGIHPWMLRYRLLARIFCVVVLPISPLIYGAAILWENREGFSEMKTIVKAAFLPWRVNP